jgi:transcriptional regulator with XRE-family HTH domain
MNVALKVACIESGKDQMEIAALAKIHVTRLSQIIRNRVTATESEKLRIAGVLQRSVETIFPVVGEAVSE